MTCVETFATLRVFSDAVHPEAIGERLRVKATELLPRDPSSPYRPRRDTNYWGWCTRGFVDSSDNSQHITAIIEKLQGKQKILGELRTDGCEIDICCYWVSTGQGGPSLDVAMMKSLCELGLSIWWDVYFNRDADT